MKESIKISGFALKVLEVRIQFDSVYQSKAVIKLRLKLKCDVQPETTLKITVLDSTKRSYSLGQRLMIRILFFLRTVKSKKATVNAVAK